MRPGFETLCHPKDPLIRQCLTSIYVMCKEKMIKSVQRTQKMRQGFWSALMSLETLGSGPWPRVVGMDGKFYVNFIGYALLKSGPKS